MLIYNLSINHWKTLTELILLQIPECKESQQQTFIDNINILNEIDKIKNQEFGYYMKKIECTERKLFNIDITVNTLKKLKRKNVL